MYRGSLATARAAPGRHPEAENWNEPGGLEDQGLSGVDPLAPCSNEVALRSRGPQEEIEAALRLRGLRPDPWPRVEAVVRTVFGGSDQNRAAGKERAETWRPATGK
ncbi:hypothetical protein NDU88_004894 [Pleurodeles waltl]|uniref:Uncharacterized protein n=1 Tax=Pleurodeles waltl TaxID=8319 RepID=A0AAV7LLC5_PLEWA|nr:hypothetical protein NDU88_004894 [Pleurodeles waltl]